MVNARLHTICGNCGCSDMFELSIDRDVEHYTKSGDYKMDVAHLSCRNCGTLHKLDEDSGISCRCKKTDMED